MKQRFKIDELIINLPDFALNKIEDAELHNAIESELAINSEFRNEFRLIKNTLGFMQSSESEVPDESYFSALSARIMQRIDNESPQNKNFNISEFLRNHLKIILPALCIVILALLFILNSNKDNITNTKITEKTSENPVIKSPDIKESDKKNSIQKSLSYTDSVKSEKKNLIVKNRIKKTPAVIIPEKDSSDFAIPKIKDEAADDIFADIFSDEENLTEEIETNGIDMLNLEAQEETDPEEEFDELTPEDQQEILNNLIKSKI